MPRGYRYILVAFVGWLSLAAANSQPENKQQATAANQAAPAPPPYAPYAKLSEDACYHAKDHNAADLCAQWRAAVAAERAAKATETATVWSKFATALSGLALGALIWTLIQTEIALSEARRGNRLSMKANARATRRSIAGAADTKSAIEIAARNADAAAAQVSISEETAYRRLRAYLSVEEVSIDKVSDNLIKGRLRIKNAGATPAAVTFFLTPDIAHFPKADPALDGPAAYRSWNHKPFINSNSIESVDWFTPTGEASAAKIQALFADQESQAIYFYGRIEFIDYGKRHRVLHFAFRNHGHLIVGKPCEMVPTPDGNGYDNKGVPE